MRALAHTLASRRGREHAQPPRFTIKPVVLRAR